MILNQDGLELFWKIIQIELAELQDNAIFDGIYLKDQVNGFTYLLEFINGDLISSCKINPPETHPLSVIFNIPPGEIIADGDVLDTNWYTVIAQCEDGSEKTIKVYEATAISTIDGVQTMSILYNEMGTIYSTTVDLSGEPVYTATTMLSDFIYTTDENNKQILEDYIGSDTNLTIPNSFDIIV